MDKQTIHLFIIVFLFFAVSICSFIIGAKMTGYMLLVNEYGAKRVKSENLKIVKAKPKMVISNGDVFGASTTTPYYTLNFLLAVSFTASFFILLNSITKGWVLRTLKKEGLASPDGEDKIKLEFPKKWFEDD